MKNLLTFLLTALLAFSVGWAATTVTFEATMNDTGLLTEITGKDHQVVTSGGVTLTFGNGTNTTYPTYYSNGHALRLYKTNTMTVSCSTGMSITEIVLTYSSQSNNSLSLVAGETGYSYDSSIYVGTWTGSSSSVHFYNAAISGNSRIYRVTVTINDSGSSVETCATPTFSPDPEDGPFTSAQNVSISCATSGATIYYTTDGTTPTTSSAVYSSAITVNETTTIKAIAVASGYDNSAVAEATYTINSGTTPTGKTYQKITSTSDLTDGNYLIVYEDGSLAFDGSLNTLDAVGNTFEVTISDDKITTPTPGYFTYDATAHSLKSYSGFYIGRTGDSNGLNTSTSEAYANSISFDNGNANIVGSGCIVLKKVYRFITLYSNRRVMLSRHCWC